MATLQRRTQRRRVHQRAQWGWNPIDHNAWVAGTKRYRARQLAIRSEWRSATKAVETAGTAIRGLGTALGNAANTFSRFLQSLEITSELIIALAAARQYGQDAELTEDDIDYLISAEMRRARAEGTDPNWQRLRDRMEAESVRNAVMDR